MEGGGSRPARILVVEDSAHIARLFQFMLERSGYEVELAADGEQAIQCAESFAPDAVILDWTLPSLSGGELVAKLRSIPAVGRKPILVVTATRLDPEEIAESDVDAHAVKPISPTTLIEHLRELGVATTVAT